MTSCAPFLPCRAAFSRLLTVAFLASAALAGCGTDDGDIKCSGGRIERNNKCVCNDDEQFVDGQCRHTLGMLPPIASNVVDRGGSTGHGLSLALDSANYPHLAYREANNNDLRYATPVRSSGKWRTEDVDKDGDLGYDTSIGLAELAAGEFSPVITYYDKSHRSLKGALRTADGWVRVFLDPRNPDPALDRGTFSSLAVENGQRHTAHVSYLDPVSNDLYYVRWDLDRPDDVSSPRLVDSGFSEVGGQLYGSGIIDDQTSIALTSEGAPVIAYRDAKQGDLKVASYDIQQDAWATKFVDNDPLTQVNFEDLGAFASIAVDSIDNFHVAYYDASQAALKYALFDGSDWIPEVVDRGQVGTFTSIAVDKDRAPFIAYYDRSRGAAKVAKKNRDGTWQVEVVAQHGIAGQFVRLALTDVGLPAIAYREFYSEATYFMFVDKVFR